MKHIVLIGSAVAALLFGAAPASADDIGRDIRDIRRDRADIRHDLTKFQEERAERDYALKRELRAVLHGNFGAAETWDARRRHEQREVNGIRSDLYRDRTDLAGDRAELRWDLRHY
jgi:Sec-independent protein translocase protein TatA